MRQTRPDRDRLVLVDCRLLAIGGAGRATELLLRGLHKIQPPGEWLLWGPPEVETYRWPGASVQITPSYPMRLGGQREVLRMPRHTVALYLHQVRPLRPGPSVTLMHDTIQLRFGMHRTPTPIKRGFLRAVARLSTRIVTVSDYSRKCLVRDLGIDEQKIVVIDYPIDESAVARILDKRARLPRVDEAIYVGSFYPHKNLDRLVAAFPATRLAQQGGKLRLVGGTPLDVAALRARLPAGSSVVVEGKIDDDRLETLYATARCLVMPSLEEGFGLPLWEALCCGLPAASSTAGSLPEVGGSRAHFFDPGSTEEMARAIDAAAADEPGAGLLGAPTVEAYAAAMVGHVDAVARVAR